MPDGDSDFFLDPELKFQRPELVDFLGYWNAKRGTRQFPGRADIAPRDLLKILPWMHLYDVLEAAGEGHSPAGGGRQFRVRLMGSNLAVSMLDFARPGEFISDFPPSIFKRMHLVLNWVIEARAPLRTYSTLTYLPGQEFQGSEACYAPLSDDGTVINVIAGVLLLEKRK